MSVLTRLFKIKKIKPIKKKARATKKHTKKGIQKRPIKKNVQKKTIKREKAIGVASHYFPKVKVAVIKIKNDSIDLGDTLHIKGHTTDFIQKVDSIQIDHLPIKKAKKGAEIGLRVKSRVRHNDLVYK